MCLHLSAYVITAIGRDTPRPPVTPRSMAPIVLTSGFQKELICLRPFQGNRLREYINLESTIDLGHGNLFQRKLKRLEPDQGQKHKPLTNLRSTLDQGFRTLMKKDPIKVGYLNPSDLCRFVSRHPTTGSGTLIADARDI